MSEHDEQGTSDLGRRLDAAFAAARPRRGFEDELWARLRARRPWWRRLGDALQHAPLGRVAAGLAALLLVGLVATVVRSGGISGHGAASTASSGLQQARSPESVPGAAGPSRYDPASGLPFGPLPPPAAAGVLQVINSAAPSALPAGAQGVVVRGASPPPAPPFLAVYRFDPAAGPPNGAILETGAVPPGLSMGVYPTLPAADAVAAAQAGTGSSATVVLTQARLVYVAVVSGGQGYLEPAYLFTGAEGSTRVQLLVSALAPSALR